MGRYNTPALPISAGVCWSARRFGPALPKPAEPKPRPGAELPTATQVPDNHSVPTVPRAQQDALGTSAQGRQLQDTSAAGAALKLPVIWFAIVTPTAALIATEVLILPPAEGRCFAAAITARAYRHPADADRNLPASRALGGPSQQNCCRGRDRQRYPCDLITLHHAPSFPLGRAPRRPIRSCPTVCAPPGELVTHHVAESVFPPNIFIRCNL